MNAHTCRGEATSLTPYIEALAPLGPHTTRFAVLSATDTNYLRVADVIAAGASLPNLRIFEIRTGGSLDPDSLAVALVQWPDTIEALVLGVRTEDGYRGLAKAVRSADEQRQRPGGVQRRPRPGRGSEPLGLCLMSPWEYWEVENAHDEVREVQVGGPVWLSVDGVSDGTESEEESEEEGSSEERSDYEEGEEEEESDDDRSGHEEEEEEKEFGG